MHLSDFSVEYDKKMFEGVWILIAVKWGMKWMMAELYISVHVLRTCTGNYI